MEEELLGDKPPTSKIEIKYVSILAMYIPPSDSDAKLQVIAGERVPIEVNPL
jgi:hypothetical protein